MTDAMSLRTRLIGIILIPLLAIAGMVGVWAAMDAEERASDRFDRSLLSVALAVSRDVAVSDGDALSVETNRLLQDTSGGRVFYHVYAPDGVFVTGFATPPVPPANLTDDPQRQAYFDAVYLGREVRVLRFEDAMQIEGLSGDFTFTIWQDKALRRAIVADLSWRTFRVMASLVIALALIVWFGVRLGLRPLLDLQDAIAQRSSDELSPIRRAVPEETRGIVTTFNALLEQVSAAMRAKDDFISNAAHQLRNPIAGVLAMSEAVHSARTPEDMRERSHELVAASQRASDLAKKLLTFERAKAKAPREGLSDVDLGQLLEDLVEGHMTACEGRNVSLTLQGNEALTVLRADQVMLREALVNLLDNGLLHGGPALQAIRVTVDEMPESVAITVTDDGKGIAGRDIEKALERFGQIETSGGSGLGLSIAQAVAHRHGGQLRLESCNPGLSVRLVLPR